VSCELLLYCVVNMMDHAKVSVKDFELLKVLGTGGQCFIVLQCILIIAVQVFVARIACSTSLLVHIMSCFSCHFVYSSMFTNQLSIY